VGLGIGGGIGPFRAGISTRGIGGGIGPISAGTGWGGGGSGCATLIGAAIIIGCIYFSAAWPFLLGTWTAVEFGAGNPSIARSVTGWIFEGVYIVALVAILVAGARERLRAQQESNRIATIERVTDELNQYKAQATHLTAVRTLSLSLTKLLGTTPTGTAGHPDAPPSESHLFSLPGIYLIEPRVQSRGGPRVPTRIECGTAVVTNRALRFVGESKSVEWRIDRVVNLTVEPEHLTFAVSNRKTISGLGGNEGQVKILAGLALWAQGLAAGTVNAAQHHFECVTVDMTRELNTIPAEVERLTEQLAELEARPQGGDITSSAA
jgi:hypothetical protein